MRIAEFRESSNLWTHIALQSSLCSMSVWVSDPFLWQKNKEEGEKENKDLLLSFSLSHSFIFFCWVCWGVRVITWPYPFKYMGERFFSRRFCLRFKKPQAIQSLSPFFLPFQTDCLRTFIPISFFVFTVPLRYWDVLKNISCLCLTFVFHWGSMLLNSDYFPFTWGVLEGWKVRERALGGK